jgi:Reverse transcriptase (RNA-dependent DNA polymerase)
MVKSSPVASIATVRALLSQGAAKDLEIEQINVKTALLNGPLQEQIYMETPEGYDFGGKVLKLKKGGPLWAARAWNTKLVSVLVRLEYSKSTLWRYPWPTLHCSR